MGIDDSKFQVSSGIPVSNGILSYLGGMAGTFSWGPVFLHLWLSSHRGLAQYSPVKEVWRMDNYDFSTVWKTELQPTIGMWIPARLNKLRRKFSSSTTIWELVEKDGDRLYHILGLLGAISYPTRGNIKFTHWQDDFALEKYSCVRVFWEEPGTLSWISPLEHPNNVPWHAKIK